MLYAIVAVLILILDQGMKYYATLNLPVDTGVKALVPGLLQLRNIHNSGSAFSFLNSWPYARWLFLGVTLVFVILVILALSRRWIKGGFGRWMALFVLAGALGNGIDRCLYGYVVDMLEFAFKLPLIGSFPVFNVADVFITCGAIAFCLYILLHKEHPAEAKAYGHVRSGPGGSVTTRPAPKPKAKPEPKAAPARAAKADTPAAEPASPRREVGRREAAPRETGRREAPRGGRRVAVAGSFTDQTKRRPGEDPFSEWMAPSEKSDAAPAAEQPAAKPAESAAREVAPEAPSAGESRPAVTLDIPTRRTGGADIREPSGPITLDIPTRAAREMPEQKPSGPITLDIPTRSASASSGEAHKTPSGPITLDIPAAAPSRDKRAAEPSGPVKLDLPEAAKPAQAPKPAATVLPDIPAAAPRAEAPKRAEPVQIKIERPAPSAEAPKRAAEPLQIERTEMPKSAAEPLQIERPAPRTEAPKRAEPLKLDTQDEEEFTLEDILNEFRDL